MTQHTFHGWGGIAARGQLTLGEDLRALTEGASLSRGLGRSYGDAALPYAEGDRVAGTERADRFVAWDPSAGVLRAEAGLSLAVLKRVMLPRGWFVPVSPGTQFVTLGGMVAADVHGKNHHVAGTLGQHVLGMTMRVADGRVVEVSRDHHPDLFRATLGGMGLTGHILDVTLRLERVPSPWIWREQLKVPDIDAFLDVLGSSAESWPMTVGWIDLLSSGASLGRGLMMRGRWAQPSEAPPSPPGPRFSPSVPVDVPAGLLNDATMRAFNTLYYHRQRVPKIEGVQHPDAWFYPLDAIREWRRVYGRAGFTQHQAVIPKEAGAPAVRRFVELLARLGGSSFLCVIKDCGAEGEGLLSFPKPGTSIALDIPMRSGTPELVGRLNRFVRDVGGRIYLAKDALTSAEDFRAMEGARLDAFEAVRREWDPQGTIRSALSARLMGDR